MYLDELNKCTEALFDIAKDPNFDEQALVKALYGACNLLTRLPNTREFQDDLANIEILRNTQMEPYKKIISNFGNFKEFFVIEKKLLLKNKLNKELISRIEREAERLYANIGAVNISVDEILNSIKKLRHYVCRESNDLINQVDKRVVAERATQGLFGASILVVNAKALPFEIALPGGTLLASSVAGFYVLGNCFDEDYLVARLNKFFRRKPDQP
jgi:hypothetical protein